MRPTHVKGNLVRRRFRSAASILTSTCDHCCGTLRLVGTAIGGTDMSLQNYLSELERKHQALEREIQDEMSHPGIDGLKLAELKRRKLQLKDEIAKLRRSDQRSLH